MRNQKREQGTGNGERGRVPPSGLGQGPRLACLQLLPILEQSLPEQRNPARFTAMLGLRHLSGSLFPVPFSRCYPSSFPILHLISAAASPGANRLSQSSDDIDRGNTSSRFLPSMAWTMRRAASAAGSG